MEARLVCYDLTGTENVKDLTLLGHIAFLRQYAVELRALTHAAPGILTKLRQIADSLEADADQLQKIATRAGN